GRPEIDRVKMNGVELRNLLCQRGSHVGRIVEPAQMRRPEVPDLDAIESYRLPVGHLRIAIPIDAGGETVHVVATRRQSGAHAVYRVDGAPISSGGEIGGHDVKNSHPGCRRYSASSGRITRAGLRPEHETCAASLESSRIGPARLMSTPMSCGA